MITDRLTHDQKLAAVATRNFRNYAAVNGTTPEAVARELASDERAEVQNLMQLSIGTEVLKRYSLHQFSSYNSFNVAHHEADKLEADGYQTILTTSDTNVNRYTVVGFKPRDSR